MTATPTATLTTFAAKLAKLTETDELTTAELALAFDVTPRRLRRNLRGAGLGVGKGRTYRVQPAAFDELAQTLGVDAG